MRMEPGREPGSPFVVCGVVRARQRQMQWHRVRRVIVNVDAAWRVVFEIRWVHGLAPSFVVVLVSTVRMSAFVVVRRWSRGQRSASDFVHRRSASEFVCRRSAPDLVRCRSADLGQRVIDLSDTSLGTSVPTAVPVAWSVWRVPRNMARHVVGWRLVVHRALAYVRVAAVVVCRLCRESLRRGSPIPTNPCWEATAI